MTASIRVTAVLSVVLGATACSTPTGPLVLRRAPDLIGTVSSTTRRDYVVPVPNGAFDGYGIFLAVGPSTTANRGLLVSDSTPVFIDHVGAVSRATPADITAHDSVRVWHNAVVVPYDPGQVGCISPPQGECYVATQVVVVR